jgi:hypothetical protein
MMDRYRFATDGFLDLRDRRRVRMPGRNDKDIPATPEDEALTFLLSHSFPGHRRIVKKLTESDRKKIQLAIWATTVGERMTLVDSVWRSITQPAAPPADSDQPEQIQVVCYGDGWAYPVCLDGNVTRVVPHGGLPAAELQPADHALDLKTA